MDEQRKAEIRERLSKATPGPWMLIGFNEYIAPVGISVAPDDGGVTDADAALIAHAPSDLADLLAELDRTTGDLAVASEVARERGQEVERLTGELAAYDRLAEAIDALNALQERP